MNIVLLKGELHQVLRDIGLMLPDLMHLALPIIEYKYENVDAMIIYSSEKEMAKYQIKTQDIMKFFIVVLCLWYIGNNI